MKRFYSVPGKGTIELEIDISTFEKDEVIDILAFDDNKSIYDRLIKLNEFKYVVKALRDQKKIKVPFVIEFTGTPRSGKTTTIEVLKDFFEKAGFKICVVSEFIGSDYFKNQMVKLRKQLSNGAFNALILDEVIKETKEIVHHSKYDVIIIDRGIYDRYIWNYLRLQDGSFTEEEFEELKKITFENSRHLIDFLVIMTCNSENAIKRDYRRYISLEPRRFLTFENVELFNRALFDVKDIMIANANYSDLIFTDCTDKQKVCIEVANIILKAMQDRFLMD